MAGLVSSISEVAPIKAVTTQFRLLSAQPFPLKKSISQVHSMKILVDLKSRTELDHPKRIEGTFFSIIESGEGGLQIVQSKCPRL